MIEGLKKAAEIIKKRKQEVILFDSKMALGMSDVLITIEDLINKEQKRIDILIAKSEEINKIKLGRCQFDE
ncbi:hypothetical protein [Clostridium sp.]|uniref:hypothetical protein n=1 Tax=Clostridium sp. TaxID=1506 RepID=UPI002FCA4D49